MCLDINAQTNSDSLKISKIDSIVQYRYNRDFFSDLTQMQVFDSTDNKTVIGRFKNGQIIDIYYSSEFGECESATFSLLGDSLIFVDYQLSYPDIKSDMPNTTYYKIYFHNNNQFFQSVSHYGGGAQTCDSYSPTSIDFIKECIYFKRLLTHK